LAGSDIVALKEILMEDFKNAMRGKDTIRKDAVQMVRAAILQIEKDNKVVLDDNGVLEVISKEVKKRKDVLPEYERSGRQDLVSNLEKEIEVLTAYLPEQLSAEEVEKIVSETISEVGAQSPRDIGKVMAAILPKVKGKADGRTVNEFVKKLLV
jgi:uncharacterized protein